MRAKKAHSNNVTAIIASWITLIRAASPPTFPTAGEGKNLGSPEGGAVGVSRLRGDFHHLRLSPLSASRMLGTSPEGRGEL